MLNLPYLHKKLYIQHLCNLDVEPIVLLGLFCPFRLKPKAKTDNNVPQWKYAICMLEGQVHNIG